MAERSERAPDKPETNRTRGRTKGDLHELTARTTSKRSHTNRICGVSWICFFMTCQLFPSPPSLLSIVTAPQMSRGVALTCEPSSLRSTAPLPVPVRLSFACRSILSSSSESSFPSKSRDSRTAATCDDYCQRVLGCWCLVGTGMTAHLCSCGNVTFARHLVYMGCGG